ncbi:MAG: hydrogenase expression/formation protein HupK [Rhodocyclaceae bacterium]|nr:MAG: hydrogenase expression/formation protein HupK [Rhodocyclaceae bacterium]TND03842.1 MAG: hydrogenase expression/formation protein HupK [Rhodocyclaceae bacterium]
MTAGIDAGCVRLRIGSADGRISSVSVASERPAVASYLRGRPADDAVRLVPLLFALCGQAQGRAAALALAAARGTEVPAQLDSAIQREALREHLWRWLLDLPVLLGEVALREELVAAARWASSGQRDELAALLNDARIGALRRRLATMEDVSEPAPRLLPLLDARASLDCWPRLDADFCRMPHWQGAAAETGAIARQNNSAGTTATAFAARWLARLEELRDWASGTEKVGAGGTASAAQLSVGSGRALVETARGLLMHEIVLDGERIADYFIVAPTEWNFHPQGPLGGWLMGRDAADREALQAFAARAVAALDPCVRWELEWL